LERERDLESRVFSLLIELVGEITQYGGRNHGVGHLLKKHQKPKTKKEKWEISIP